MITTNKGLIYLFSGNGKGKTSSAIGMVIRTLALKKKVVWISWYKCEDWKIGEGELTKMLQPVYRKNLTMHWMGKGFYLGKKLKTAPVGVIGNVVVDKDEPTNHKLAAAQAIALANGVLKNGGISLLVLDEILNAVSDGLVSKNDVISLMEKRGGTNLVLTGRGSHPMIEKMSDLISRIEKIKHPYDKGVLAVAGLDF